MKKVLLIFILVLVGLYSGCGREKHIFRPKPVVGSYPLKVGNYWKYSGKYAWFEYDLTKEIVGVDTTQAGLKAFKVRYLWTYPFQDTIKNQMEWFAYQALIDNEIREFSDLTDTSSYEIILRFPVKVGASWQKPPTQMDSMVVISMFIDSVVAIEYIFTPAGDFPDCYKITTSFLGDLVYFRQDKWFKPRVGFVKYWNSPDGFGLTYSLEDYKVIAE